MGRLMAEMTRLMWLDGITKVSELTEEIKNRIADRKERYAKQQVRREKLEQTMEKNGLIQRTSVKKDARLKKIEMTDEGRAMERKIHTKVEAMEQQISGCLTEEELKKLQAFFSMLKHYYSPKIHRYLPDTFVVYSREKFFTRQ